MEDLRTLLRRHYRIRGSGNLTIDVQHTPNLTRPTISTKQSVGESYSRKCWYKKTDNTVTIEVDVQQWDKSLKVADGIVNLYTKQINKIKGITIYEAIWVEQSRGLSVYSVAGFIASCGGKFYHSTVSGPDAYRGLKQKIKLSNLESVITELQSNSIPPEWLNIPVSRKDSKNAGNCPVGTRNFIEKFDLGEYRSVSVEKLFSLRKDDFTIRASAAAILKVLE